MYTSHKHCNKIKTKAKVIVYPDNPMGLSNSEAGLTMFTIICIVQSWIYGLTSYLCFEVTCYELFEIVVSVPDKCS